MRAINPLDDESAYVGLRLGPPPATADPPDKADRKRTTGPARRRFRLLRRFWRCPATPGLSTAAVAVWCYLWFLADPAGQCHPSLSRIGALVGISRRHAQRAIAELRAAGFLVVIVKGSNTGENRANVYKIGVHHEE